MKKYLTKKLIGGLVFGIGAVLVFGAYLWVQAQVAPGTIQNPTFGPQDQDVTVSTWEPGMFCGLSLAQSNPALPCQGTQPASGCPAGFQQVSFYYENGAAGNFWTCIKI